MWIKSGGELRYVTNDYQGSNSLAAVISAANNFKYTGELTPPPEGFNAARWAACVKRVSNEGPPPQFRNYRD